MKLIGQAMGPWADPQYREQKIRELAESFEAQRQEGIRELGWAQDCECHECGDTGTNRHTRRNCWCEVGRANEHRHAQEAAWDKDVPWRFREHTLDTHPNTHGVQQVRRWIMNDFKHGRNAIIVGPVGTGKTGLAIGALRELHENGVRSTFGTFAKFLEELRPTDDPAPDRATIDKLVSVPLLVMDDLGAERVKDWPAERLFLVVDERYQARKPIVITTNKGLDELENMMPTQLHGKRIMSRLVQESTIIGVGGPDLRQQPVVDPRTGEII